MEKESLWMALDDIRSQEPTVLLTNEGMLGLSPYLQEKVVERLKELDAQARKNS